MGFQHKMTGQKEQQSEVEDQEGRDDLGIFNVTRVALLVKQGNFQVLKQTQTGNYFGAF